MFGLIKRKALLELQSMHENLLSSKARELKDGHFYILSMPACREEELEKIAGDLKMYLAAQGLKNIAIKLCGAHSTTEIEIKSAFDLAELEPPMFSTSSEPLPELDLDAITSMRKRPKKKKGGKKIGKKINTKRKRRKSNK